MTRFLIFLPLVLLAAWLQGSYLTVVGIKPNLILAVFVALSFLLKSFWSYFGFSLVGAIILRPLPSLSWDLMVIWLVLTGLFFLKKFLPWHDAVNFIVSAIAGTLAIYLLISPGFIISHYFLVAGEAVVTLAIGAVLLLLLHRYAEKQGLRF